MNWEVNFRIYRYKQDGSAPRYDTFTVEVKPDEYVLGVLERIWAKNDRSLVFRHACHHAACGTCGMRVNGREKLACVTLIESVTSDGCTVTVEPLRHLPVVSDLLVDMASFYSKMEQAQFVPVRAAEPMVEVATRQLAEEQEPAVRFENCIECGMCVSACPISGTDPTYLGPAALAAIERMVQEPRCDVNVPSLVQLADSEHGLWRCHAAFECTEVCPSNVDPAALMMTLRRQVLVDKVKWLLGRRRG